MNRHRLCILSLVALLALAAAAAAQELNREGEDWPTDARARTLAEREIEIGQLGPIKQLVFVAPRYLVTYMKSRTTDSIRAATVVTVTNQSASTCRVSVSYFKGFSNNAFPVCATSFSIPSEFTVDFCSRAVPTPITTCNSTCSPGLTFDEGRAIVSSSCKEIGVSSRVYYTMGANDDRISGISDSKIVRIASGNNGD